MSKAIQLVRPWGACAALVCVVGLLPNVGAAQSNDSLALEEIVVIAQKREQSQQEVAASIDVVTADDLFSSGASAGVDILKYTPGMTLFQDQDPRTTRFTIRGLSSQAFETGVEPSTAIIIDGETLARPSVLNMDLSDV
ncbi:MAG: TonB-dependent receptor plug domain-containing protein, partial [Gammaproteobacteria bacterium]|nr:TonB-dependent receptor plug domain-containing protein [Gammaproteobacteria bacterium]